jgi:hypothetical protein
MKMAGRGSSALVELCKRYELLEVGNGTTGDSIARDETLLEVDYGLLSRLCMLGCSREELAYALGSTEQALDKATQRDKGYRLSEYQEYHSQAIRVAIRRKQLEVALGRGDTKMLMYLGQVYLGQGGYMRRSAAVNSSSSSSLSVDGGGGGKPGKFVSDSTLIQIIHNNKEERGNGSSEVIKTCLSGGNKDIEGSSKDDKARDIQGG